MAGDNLACPTPVLYNLRTDTDREVALRIRITLVAIVAACGFMVVPQPGGAQQMAIGPFTAAQAQAGRAAYQGTCGACHAPDLSGREGPQLAGANFMSQWGTRTAGELIGFMRA